MLVNTVHARSAARVGSRLRAGYLRRDLRRRRDRPPLTAFIRPVSSCLFNSHDSATAPARIMAATVSPRRNACHASPLRAGMTRVPMTTPTATRTSRSGWVKMCPRTMARVAAMRKDPEVETQTECPMPQHVHADGGDRESQPGSSSPQSLSPPVAGISDLSRQESGYEAGDDSHVRALPASRSLSFSCRAARSHSRSSM